MCSGFLAENEFGLKIQSYYKNIYVHIIAEMKRPEILCEYICMCVCICVRMYVRVRTHDFSSLVRFLVHFPKECIYD